MALALCFVLLSPAIGLAEPFATKAPVAFLIDETSGSVILSKNADRPVEPAAMAKLMTMAVVGRALGRNEIALDTVYPISVETWRKGGAPSGSATMFAPVKSRIAVSDLLRGAIVQAANDACYALSEGMTGKLDGLVPRMNDLAAEIGLSHTVFRNVTGFSDPQQTTTARDLATLLAWLRDNEPAIYAIYGEKEFTWNKIRQTNRNPLLTEGLGVDGGSTGASDGAGYGLVVSAMHGNQHFVLVLHGLQSVRERAEEARRLLEWAEGSFEPKIAFAKDVVVAHASVYGGNTAEVPLVADRDVSVLARKEADERLAAQVVYDGPVEAPIRKGDVVAHLQITRDGQVSQEVPLHAAADVPIGSLPRRAFGAIYELGVGLVRGEPRKR
ncbi:D-alanyl-D-alanine carboxypeptidase family protein [Labrys monachus]|uniref:serine-type D-Ala-D-Ala carboxypeptidase n=1 Tax=Labrys monachus TaxID=217067 RepID=A0ABU0FEB2_9HYPH|nr:D-alanyl-D-alanine carboxypeptidase family protein [Labrys monachus]MDQ0392948.1 D-alanyl-D-alanine carboxypeptidase (penicillin-binding protein 5/6) [Labrys monachus]